jgi:AcrR family transcriptional regulator
LSERRPKALASLPEVTKTSPTPAYHHGDLRVTLVRCGRELLEKNGAANMSLRAAARLAGVSAAAPAHHFRNKDGLLAAIAIQGFRELAQSRLRAIRSRAAPEEVLRRVILAHAEFVERNPQLFHLMFGNELLRRGQFLELNEAATTSYELLRHVVRDWLGEGRAASAREGPATLAVWMMMHGLGTAVADRQSFPASAGAVSTPQLVNVMIQLLSAGPGPASPR